MALIERRYGGIVKENCKRKGEERKGGKEGEVRWGEGRVEGGGTSSDAVGLTYRVVYHPSLYCKPTCTPSAVLWN